MLDFAPFRDLYVREFDLSHSNLVNGIIKITHTHNLHVKMLDFAPLKLVRERTHIVYKIICSNDFDKSPPFLRTAIKLCIIHYFTSSGMVVC